ncbi:lantibiotic dehydratase [Myroides sp. DF42-4-2]|uniref:lantibiotic dehydratase n=1 Tax=Myroides sp. DF42-4-2 TaxID=2746726 RepID=UPI002577DF34|nr:lantibiotic dehydratase [Myroides sp. DF42-4-2]MDM1408647.1 lantibiotic dehydratase [Myroides sp. DF42-4-2]
MIHPVNFFVVRFPTLPFNRLQVLNNAIKENNIQLIKKYWMNPIFLSAIYLSSKDFYTNAQNWIQREEFFSKPSDAIFQSLYKYNVRMCSRSTPYGLFAGTAFGEIIDDFTRIEINTDNVITCLRVDNLFLKMIKDKIIEDSCKNNLHFFPNNTLYSIGNSWRYISWDQDYNYEISEITKNPVLDKILKLAQSGITIDEITRFIFHETITMNISVMEIKQYVHQLIKEKFLVNRLPPYMTSCENPLFEVNDYLTQFKFETKLLTSIIKLESIIDNEFFKSFEGIKKLEELSIQYAPVMDKKHQFFQVDTKINMNINRINKNVVTILAKRVEELIGLRRREVNSDMIDFTNRFYKKFGTKEILLSKALDPDYGVGYKFSISGNIEEAPLLQDIHFSFLNTKRFKKTVSPLIELIMKKYTHCFSTTNMQPILLTKEDIDEVKEEDFSSISLGATCYLFGSFICRSQEDIDNLNFKFIPFSTIPTNNVNEILSRYAYNDKDLLNSLKDLKENDSESCIYVELLHHTENRLANVLMRPNLYNYVLSYVSECKNDDSNVILMNDVFIRYEEGRIKLRSKSLNKEIRIRYSNAYNFEHNQLPMIRFLGDYQYYDVDPGFKWNWEFMEDRDYLPRVEYKELILTEACWKIHRDKKFTIEKLQEILKDKNIPSLCTIKKRDNVLILDFSLVICLDILVKLIVKQSILLYEYIESAKFPNEVRDQFVAEFIFPFKVENETSKIAKKIIVSDEVVKRNLIPGEEWSFFKIYTSPHYGDTIIREIIQGYLRQFTKAVCWFFVRYNDPDFHIRFRIKKKITKQNLSTLNKLLHSLIKDGLVSSYQIDTYNREVERYGIDTIDLSEKYFMFDSNAILQFLSIKELLDSKIRWKVAVFSIHLMMVDFKISILDRIKFFHDLFQVLLSEIIDISDKSNVKLFKFSLNKKYRINKECLDSIIRLNNYDVIVDFVEPFIERSKKTERIISLIKEKTNEVSYIALVKDYVHMNMNRIFTSQARKQELIIYYLMFKTYNSIYCRNT